ncbi:hypothetical protein L9F63_011434, partial [Diploptera punctata]
MSGELYECKLAALLFINCVNKECDFHIASNMAAAGCYDDVVLTMSQGTAFLQLKHKQNKDAKIYTSQLFTLKGDFSLIKYWKSHLDIKQRWTADEDLQRCGQFNDSLYIIYTNASLVDCGESNVGSNEMLDLVKTGVSVEQVPSTKELLQIVRKLHNNKANKLEIINYKQMHQSHYAKTLHQRVKEVASVWKFGMCDVLVVKGWKREISTLEVKLTDLPQSKCLLVISDKHQRERQFVIVNDKFSFNVVEQLHHTLQTKLIFFSNIGIRILKNSTAVTGEFVDKKFSVYREKVFGDVNTGMLQMKMDDENTKLQQIHMNCAMFSYFVDVINLDLPKVEQKRIKSVMSFDYCMSRSLKDYTMKVRALENSEYLVKHGASVNLRDERVTLIHPFGDIDSIIYAAGNGYEEAAQFLIRNKTINSQERNGNTALSIAVRQVRLSQHDIVKLLLEHGADVDISDKYNMTPLMHAVKCTDVHIVELLVEHGADNQTDLRETRELNNSKNMFCNTNTEDFRA